MSRKEQIVNERKRKLDELRKAGIEPYPYKFDVRNYSDEIKERYKKLKNNHKNHDRVKIAGRVMAVRNLGKLIFAVLQDSKGKIQIVFQKGEINEEGFELFKKFIDVGDIIGVNGVVGKTKTGEISIYVSKIEILTKSLLPLPEKWHGLVDKEERFRKRYLDLVMNPSVKEIFVKRSKAISVLREFLESRGFLEVDTPVLQPIAGGAVAKPFITRYNAYNTDVYLRIAPELYLKKLLIGGFDKVFEFARCFRNEGVDWNHNPEFTNLEFYLAYSEYNELMKLTEDMIVEVVKEVNGKAEINRNGRKISIKKPFKKISFEKLTKGRMSDEVFKEEIKKIKEPTFVINHPVKISPLAKKNDEKTVQRFQLVIDGVEIVNAFSELNDPQEQEERFKEQAKMKEGHEYDKDFIEALEYGMPPAGGFGLGVDRFVMLLTGRNSLREVLLFPYMKTE